MKRVLIIGKSKSAVAQLKRTLTSLEYIVAGSATDGAEALAMVKLLTPDIVLTDAALSGDMDGIDTARLIQENLDTPVLLLMDHIDDHSVSRANNARLYERRVKPFKRGDLRTGIEETLKRWESKKGVSRLYEELVENTYDLIHVHDSHGNITFVNSTVSEILGYAPHEVIGKNLREFATPETYQLLTDIFKKQSKGIGARTFEMQVYDKAGNVKTFETRERIVRDGDRIVEVHGISRDITERKRIVNELAQLNRLKEQLLGSYDLADKLQLIADKTVEIFGADFARIWMTGPGDLCDKGCYYAELAEGPYICRDRSRCLHLKAGSRQYTHTDKKMYRRVPFGAHEIGRVASGPTQKLLSNNVIKDLPAYDHERVKKLGLVSFAGYRLSSTPGETTGVFALFSKKPISHEEDSLLEDLANTTAQVIKSYRAERSLRESEERYRALFDNASFGVFHSLPDGTLLRANRALAEMMGYDSVEQLVSSVKNIAQDVYVEPANRARYIAQVMREGGWGVFEERFRRKDGGVIFAKLHARSVHGPENTFEYLEGFVEDVTEKRHAEAAIRRDKEFKEKILQTAAVGIAFSENRKITWANAAFANTFGYTDEREYLGKSALMFYPSTDEFERVGKVVREAAGTGEIIETVARFKCKDSKEFVGLLRVSVLNTDDPFKEAVFSILDITARTRAEEAIHQDQELKEKILQTAGVAIGFVKDRKMAWANAAMEKVFGFSNVADYYGKDTSITYASEEEYRRVGKLLYERDRSEGVMETVANLRRMDSTGFVGLIRVSAVNPDEPTGEVVVSISDITDKKRAEEAIRRDRQLKEKILQTAGIGIAFAENRIMTWANTAFEQTFGFSDESQYVGKETSIIYATDEEYQRVGKLVYEGTGAREVIETVVKFKRADSTEFLGLLRVGAVYPDDPLKEAVASFLDITEKTRAEEEIRRDRELKEKILQTAGVGIGFTKSRRLAWANPAMKQVLGLGDDNDWVGKPSSIIYASDEEYRRVGKLLYEGTVSEGVIETVANFKRTDSTEFIGQLRASILNPADPTDEIVASIADITEKTRAEEALRESEQRYRLLAENATDIIFTMDADLRFTYISPSVVRVRGFTVEEAMTQTPAEALTPSSLEKAMGVFAKMTGAGGDKKTDRGDTLRLELEETCKDGSTIWTETTFSILRDENKKFNGILGITRDISERRRFETALAESEEKYRMVVENAYEGIAVVQGDVFVFVNRRLLDLFGYTEDEFIGRRYTDFLIADNHADAESEYRRKLSGNGYAYLSTFRVITKSGEVRWTEVSGISVPWKENPALLIFVRDITQRKMIEQALIQSEAKYRDLIENAIDLIFTVDPEGNFLEVNESLLRQTGYTKEDILSAGFKDFIHPEDMDVALTAYAKGRQGASYEFEMRSKKKDGTYEWYSFVIRPIFDIDGNVERVHGIARNITDRKAAEEALLESEKKFRGMFETSRDFMFISSIDGKLLDYNPSAREFFGFTDEEIRQSNIIDIYTNRDQRNEVLARLMKEGFVDNYEINLKKKDGSPIEALVTATVRRDRNGNIVGFQGTARDVTKLKRMERQLLQAEKLSGLGTMISGVAHEINNPLTAIMGNAELMLMNDSLIPNERKSLEVILHESERAAKIVGGLLTFAREHTAERRMIRVNDIIVEACRLREYSLRVSNIKTELFLSDDLPPTFADPYQLQQVFSNLINNARDALMDTGGGTLTIRTIRDDEKLLIEFEDDGPGIDDENVQKIFDPFFTTKDIGKGTGLGLSIAYGIVEDHNGTIEIESKPGKGAKFTIALPIINRSDEITKKAMTPQKTVKEGKSILVVDDEKDVVEFLFRVLTHYGYSVQTASAAEGALTLMDKQEFDAVVADIRMPGMGGKEMHAYVKKHMPGVAEKILFITGDILGDETQAFIVETGNVCIKKPFKIGEFISILDELVNQ